jgi:hypothetical protein
VRLVIVRVPIPGSVAIAAVIVQAFRQRRELFDRPLAVRYAA